MKRCLPLILVVALTPGTRATEAEKLPENLAVTRLTCVPERIELAGRFAYAQLLLTAESSDGRRTDVTRAAGLESPGSLVSVSDRRLVRAASDGEGQLRFTFGGQTVEGPVTVRDVAAPFEADFIRDVAPLLSKLGCNAGTCHGAANGKNGFKLSLRGYDPISDHTALTDDHAGRRFNRAAPERSLMLVKAAGSVAHTGGVLTRPGEPY